MGRGHYPNGQTVAQRGRPDGERGLCRNLGSESAPRPAIATMQADAARVPRPAPRRPTSPLRTATSGWTTAAAGAAGSSCRRSRSGCGRTSAMTGRWASAARILRRAFDLGITHFDLANNYGPPYGSAETNFGRIFAEDFARLRDELVISTKAGYDMWPGPYGDLGTRKYLLASLDQSLRAHAASTTSTSSTRTGSIPRLRSRRRWARSTAPSGRARPAYVGHLLLRPAAHRGGDRDPAPAGNAAADPPAVLLDVQPLDRAGAARRARARGRRLHRVLAAGPGAADRQVPRRDPGGLARAAGPALLRGPGHARERRAGPGAERDRPRGADSRWPRWRSPGCCATRGSPRRWSAPRASLSWSRHVAALEQLDFDDAELAEIDRYAVDGALNIWAQSSEA